MNRGATRVKQVFLSCALLGVCHSALSQQGEIGFANDSHHLVYYDPNPADLKPADTNLAGTGPSSGNMPSNVTLVADLYGGGSPGSLAPISTTSFASAQGRFTSLNSLCSFPPGMAYFQVQVRDNNYTSAASAYAAGAYSGLSDIFTCVAGSSTYNSIVNPSAPASSTWANGTYNASAFGGAGALGAIMVTLPPPPPPPTITTEPVSQTVAAGQSATFSVVASGAGTLTYQWRFNGSPISGATSNVYTVINVQPTNTGPYYVVVSNPGGSTNSAVVTLTLATNNGWISPTSGKWETGTNWGLTVPPGYTQSAYITNAGAKIVTIDATTGTSFSNTMTVSNLTLANPASATWTGITTNSAPSPRYSHTAVWTVNQMIVWGGTGAAGDLNDGGRYNPLTDGWTATSASGAPSARDSHTAVWTATEMIVWGGFFVGGGFPPSYAYWNNGGRYNPASDTWTTIPTNGAPAGRAYHTAVWTGTEMIIWGGYGNTGYLNDGWRYNPASGAWTNISSTGSPAARAYHSAVWTGTEMIVWGGYNGSTEFSDGGRYNLASNTWTTISSTGAPLGRRNHTAVWTGTEMIVWGGSGAAYFNDGGRYRPAPDVWMKITTNGAPAGRSLHAAVWTGTQMTIWAGNNGSTQLGDGASYNPAANVWTVTSTNGAPTARDTHTAVWTGGAMVVWGGEGGGGYFNNGGRYSGDAGNVLELTSGGTNPPLHMLNNTLLQKGGSLMVDGNSLLQVDGQTTIGDAGFPGAAGIGLLAVNSGTATLANTIVGNTANSYGVIGLNGGALLLTNNLVMAAQAGSTGLVSMTTGWLINTNGAEVIGTNGNGMITQTGGTNQAAILNLGGTVGSLGAYMISNATLNATTLNLGSSAGGLGTLTVQSNAVINISGNIALVSGSLSTTSSISLSGGSFIATDGLIQAGPVGRGQIVISGGTHTVRQLKLGSTNGVGAGALIVSGGSLRILGAGIGPGAGLVANLVIGLGGDFNANGTSITIGGDSHDALAYLYGGSAECAAFYVGSGTNNTGTYQQSGGVMTVTNQVLVGDCSTNAVGVVTLTGGTLYVTNASHTALLDVRNGTFTLGPGGTLVVDRLVMTNACGLFMNTGGQLVATYPPMLQPRLVPSVATSNPNSISLSFQTVATTNYVLEGKTDLAQPTWRPLVTNYGDGSFTNISIPIGGPPGFFRVRQQ